MYCKKCGSEIKEEDKFCIKCGVEVDDIDTEINKRECVKNYMELSISAIVISVMVGIFSCNVFSIILGLIFSIVGCVQSSKVDELIRKNDIEQAKKYSRKAKINSIIGIVISVGIAVVFLIAGVIFMVIAEIFNNY